MMKYQREASKRKVSTAKGLTVGILITVLFVFGNSRAMAQACTVSSDCGTGEYCMDVAPLGDSGTGQCTALSPTALPDVTCPTNFGSCSAGDLGVNAVTGDVVGGDDCTDEFLDVSVTIEYESQANQRYDIGFFVAGNGGSFDSALQPPVPANCGGTAAANGDGDLHAILGDADSDLFLDLDGDSCGDIDTTSGPVQWTVTKTIACITNEDGNLLMETAFVWNQNAQGVCTGIGNVGTGSKCRTDSLILPGSTFTFHDHGDAPASYGDPIHLQSSDLYLGSAEPDIESAAQPGPTATGDDSAGDDEDGTSFEAISPDNTVYYNLGVDVNSNLLTDAILIGGLDLNCDGDFDDTVNGVSELQSVIVGAGGCTTDYCALDWGTLDGMTPLISSVDCPAGTSTYGRVRISDNASLASLDGDGGIGEVEDYLVALDPSATPAVISQFRAEVDAESNNWLRWVTSSESGVSAFRVERWFEPNDIAKGHWARVHQPAWLPVAHSPQGAEYQLLDSSLLEGETTTYRVVERGTRGKLTSHGPYVVDSAYSDQEPFSNDFYAFKILLDVQGISERRATVSANRMLAETKGEKPVKIDHVKLGVAETGVQFVSAGDLADAMGIKARQVQNWLRQGKFELTRNGSDVSWFDTGEGLLFYGEAPDNNWSTESMYWLRAHQPGAVMPEESLSNGSVVESSFLSTVHTEEDNLPVLEMNHLQTDDYWYWTSIATVTGFDSITLPAQSPGALAEPAMLTVALQGFSEVQHEVEVSVSGEVIGTMLFTGQQRSSESFAVPAGKMGGDYLDVTLRATGAFGFSSLFIEYLELAYIRRHAAFEGQLSFSQDTGGAVHVIDLSQSEDLAVLDISSPMNPRWLKDGSFNAGAFEAGFETGDYFVANSGAWKNVSFHAVAKEQKIKNTTEYLVIAPEELMEGAQALADLRGGELKTQLVSLESIYDHTSYGEPDPRSISNYLIGSHKRPDYVVMVGDGAYDYKDQFGTGYNILSPMLVDGGRFGLVIGDTLVGDMDGDGKVEIPVGRIPAKNNAEVMQYVDKLSMNESNGHLPTLLVADDNDQAGNFSHSATWIASETTGDFSVLYEEILGASETRAQLLAQIDNGLKLVKFVGHGGIWTLTDEGIMTIADVPNLTNLAAPTLVGLTCNINNFMIPGFDSLGEHLVVKNGSGMVASWAAAGQSLNADATALGVAFQKIQGGHERLGDVMLEAFRGTTSLEQVYILLGDPAVKLH